MAGTASTRDGRSPRLYLSGRPGTPYDVHSTNRRAWHRLRVTRWPPGYFRLDLRVDRRFIVGGEPLIVFAGAENVTNRHNVAGYDWSRRTNEVVEQEQQGVPDPGSGWRF